MEAICSTETVLTTYKSTQSDDPEDHGRHLHLRENFISQVKKSKFDLCHLQMATVLGVNDLTWARCLAATGNLPPPPNETS